MGDIEIKVIFGSFEGSGRNENGKKLLELCSGRDMIIGNTWFNYTLIKEDSQIYMGKCGDR